MEYTFFFLFPSLQVNGSEKFTHLAPTHHIIRLQNPNKIAFRVRKRKGIITLILRKKKE